MTLAVLLLAGGITGLAQGGGGCSSSASHAFDFWIGDWDIRQQILRQDGSWLPLEAATSVTRALDGCALVESWRGQVMFFWEGMTAPEATSGLSVRAYNPKTSKWYIHWMDTRSPRFGEPYSGTFVDGRGEFFRTVDTPDGKRMDWITFSDVSAGSVSWELAVSHDEGRTWRTIWKMRMTRRPSG